MDSSALEAASSRLDESITSFKTTYDKRIHELEEQLRQKDAELSLKDAKILQCGDDLDNLQRELQACKEQLKTGRMEANTARKAAYDEAITEHEHPTGRMAGKRRISESQTPTSKKNRLGELGRQHPFVAGDVWIDVFSLLSRYQLDAVGFTCQRFRRIVYDSMSSACLRPIDSVSLKPNNPYRPSDAYVRLDVSSDEDTDPRIVCVVSFCYVKTVPLSARPSGSGQQVARRQPPTIMVYQDEEFSSHSAAYKYTCRLLRSAFITQLRVDNALVTWEFFTLFDQVAHTISVESLALFPIYDLSRPEDYLHSFLRLLSVYSIHVTDENARPKLVTDELLIQLAAKRLSNLQLMLEPRDIVSRVQFNVTDDGILAFLFRQGDENVSLDLDRMAVSKHFAVSLLQRAQQCSNKARVHLTIESGVDTVWQDRQLVPDYGHYRRQRRSITYKLPVTGSMRIRLQLFRFSGRLNFTRDVVNERRKRPYHESYDGSSSSSFPSSSSDSGPE